MTPPHLKPPPRDAFREVTPSDTPPADFPARLPFVANRAMSYAESAEMACCTWPLVAAGAPAPVRRDRASGLSGMVAMVREGLAGIAGAQSGDTAEAAVLEQVFDDVVAAAMASGWAPHPGRLSNLPQGWRQATLRRPGERMEILGVLSPIESGVTALVVVQPPG